MSRVKWDSKLRRKFNSLDLNKIDFFDNVRYYNIRNEDKHDGIDDDVTIELFDSIYHQDGTSYYGMHKLINEVRSHSHVYLEGKKSSLFLPYIEYSIITHMVKGGGFFYGSQEQYVDKKLRPKLKFGTSKVSEIDFNNLHTKMLYDIVRSPLSGDAYTIPFKNGANYDRKIIKASVMILINSTNESSAKSAIQFNCIKGTKYHGVYSSHDIVDAIKTKHSAISGYFGTSAGTKLQKIDSNIALHVMYHFAKRDILCLCIHDSFIVEDKHSDELMKVMKRTYREVMTDFTFKPNLLIPHDKLPTTTFTAYKNSLPRNAFKIDVT